MSEYSSLKATINANIKTNNNHEITGAITNSVLNAMVNSLGAGYQFMGMATPTNPGTAQTPDYKCFYLATTPGIYTYLGGLVVADGEVAILKYDSSWHKEVSGAATAEQLNQLGQEIITENKTISANTTFQKRFNVALNEGKWLLKVITSFESNVLATLSFYDADSQMYQQLTVNLNTDIVVDLERNASYILLYINGSFIGDNNGDVRIDAKYGYSKDIALIQGEMKELGYNTSYLYKSEDFVAQANTTIQTRFDANIGIGTILFRIASDFAIGKLSTINIYYIDGTYDAQAYTIGQELKFDTTKEIAYFLFYLPGNKVGDGGTYSFVVKKVSSYDYATLKEIEGIQNTLSLDKADNLIAFSSVSITKDGVTMTSEGDGKYYIDGTPTEYVYLSICGTNRIPVSQGQKLVLLFKNNSVPTDMAMAIRPYKNGNPVSFWVGYIDNDEFVVGDWDSIDVAIYPHKNTRYYNALVMPLLMSADSVNYPLTLIDYLAKKTKPKPILTLVDDDSASSFMTELYPIIVGKKVPITSAIPTINIGTPNHLSWDDIDNVLENGGEILSHTHTHLTSVQDLPQHEIQQDYQISKNILALHGIPNNGLIFPGESSLQPKCVDSCKNVFDWGVRASENKTNYVENIGRYRIYRWGVTPTASSTDPLCDLQSLKDLIDSELVDKNTGWMIWMLHSHSFYEDTKQCLEELIDYAINAGIQIVTMQAGVNIYLDGLS